ncbi:MAG: C39 family peptidase, partial [Verrucomicrobia bacterium]|nr:C39 family peptidase [Verrucomicrobiota bacterium]
MARKNPAKEQASFPCSIRSVSIVHLTPGDFKNARLNGLEPAGLPDGALKTAKDRFKTVTAVLISAPLKTAFPFTQALAGANAAMGPNDGLELSLQVKDDRGWSPWFEFGRFSPDGGNASVKDQSNRFGRMEIDTLILSSACRYLRYRVTLKAAPGSCAVLRLVSVTYTGADAPYNEALAVKMPPEFQAVRLEVPKISQMEQPVSYAGDICSPTSVAMILQHFGVKTRVIEAASGVRDTAGQIYGNWTLNTMYAGLKGFYAWPARFNSLEEARAYR